MIRLTVDKIASATKNAPLQREIRIQEGIVAQEGYIVAGRVRGEKTVYNQLENCNGRMVTLHGGDIIVGVLGHRNALRGYSGYVPERIAVGDVLQILNLGGVIGRCSSINPEIGQPFDLEILGNVLVFPEFEKRVGIPAHVRMNSIEVDSYTNWEVAKKVPVVYVAGTCMNAGKTYAACQLIRVLASKGLKVGACKVTGVSLLKDVLQMEDYGAKWGLSFMDAGVVTTSPATSVPTARTLVSHLIHKGAEIIIMELGDGVMGEYGVQEILADQILLSLEKVFVLCASDPVAVWGGVKYLQEEYHINVDVVSGPATDNAVGTRFVEQSMGIAAINARIQSQELGEFVFEKIRA